MSQENDETKHRELSVLISFKGHNRIGKINLGGTYDDVRRVCQETFSDLPDGFTLKSFSEEWGVWVDVTDQLEITQKEKFLVETEDQMSDDSCGSSTGTAAKQKVQRLASVMENLKGALKKTKQCDDVQERKRKATIKVQLGWHNFKSQTKSYSQVKSNRGGGVINLWVQRTITYPEIQQRALETFFPSGKSSHLGSINDYDYFVGNSRCETYDNESFSVETVFQEGGSRARMYLFTKLKTIQQSQIVQSINSSSSDDDDLINPFLDPILQDIPGPSGSTRNSSVSFSVPSGTPTVHFNLPKNVDKCEICCNSTKNAFFIPCGHSVCQSCAARVYDGDDKRCPFCKGQLDKVGTLY